MDLSIGVFFLRGAAHVFSKKHFLQLAISHNSANLLRRCQKYLCHIVQTQIYIIAQLYRIMPKALRNSITEHNSSLDSHISRTVLICFHITLRISHVTAHILRFTFRTFQTSHVTYQISRFTVRTSRFILKVLPVHLRTLECLYPQLPPFFPFHREVL